MEDTSLEEALQTEVEELKELLKERDEDIVALKGQLDDAEEIIQEVKLLVS